MAPFDLEVAGVAPLHDVDIDDDGRDGGPDVESERHHSVKKLLLTLGVIGCAAMVVMLYAQPGLFQLIRLLPGIVSRSAGRIVQAYQGCMAEA